MPETTKLRAHINAGEPQLSELRSMLTVADIVTEHLCEAAIVAREAMGGGSASDTPPEEALAVLLRDVGDRVEELRSWYRQLHELGVVGSGETANG